ncbi:hypothetical protein ABMA28_005741 [Loxostege sticticalis]|uniref:Uncharacterized protein n=1 Tax=Loxostege sticticalis TaxID=481309 RepID=A0ABD0SMR6_LOXSC
MIRKSASCQVYHQVTSTSSDVSTSSSLSSESNSTPLKKFNRLFRTAVTRHWSYFSRNKRLKTRGRSVSDTGLCDIINDDWQLVYLDIPEATQRPSLQGSQGPSSHLPTLFVTSAGGSGSVAGEEASDGSDAERPRRGHHLRVPTPAFTGQAALSFKDGGVSSPCSGKHVKPLDLCLISLRLCQIAFP